MQGSFEILSEGQYERFEIVSSGGLVVVRQALRDQFHPRGHFQLVEEKSRLGYLAEQLHPTQKHYNYTNCN